MEIRAEDNKFIRFLKCCVNKYNKIWSSNRASFLVLAIFLLIIALVLIIYPLCYDTIYNCYTDDVLQYYPYVTGFFNKLKHGDLSIFDTSLLGGASFFSSAYYVPLDLFVWLAFLLSYIMPAEVAYSISNILRVIGGAMLIYYVFYNKGFRPRVSFIISIIYCVGGMMEAYYIFPVYLGIIFYAPLAMLIVDLILHRDTKFLLLVPIYGVTIVLYDFYIAYMLFAFLCIYFLIEASLSYERFFLINKEFWQCFLYFMLMVFLGVSMSAFFLFPASLYIVNETGRATQSGNDYLWLFGTINNEGKLELSLRHYFVQWTNLFTANTPHNLGLVSPGDYIREHASMYLTTGGAMYLAYFFFVGGKRENRLKPWVLLFNLLFCIPLFSMIFTFNEWPYVRWFFIPYIINFYAMAMAMNKYDFEIGTNKYLKLIPFIFMLLGLGTMLYVLICAPDIFFHYDRESIYFNPIVIGSIVFISILLILLLISFILNQFKRDDHFIYRLIPFTIFAEAIFASVIAFSTIGSYNMLSENNNMKDLKNHLYSLGYNEADGYRINMYTKDAKKTYNANVMLGNVNHARFFQSFYNTPLSVYYEDIHNEGIYGWSKVSMHGYTPLSGPMFNLKYVLAEKDLCDLKMPERLYNSLGSYNNVSYYEMKETPQFIVYDKLFEKDRGYSKRYLFYNDVALLSYGYIKKPIDNASADKKELKRLEHQRAMYNKIAKNDIPIYSYNEVVNEIKHSPYIESVTISSPDSVEYNNYYVYDFTDQSFDSIRNMDMLYVIPDSIQLSQDAAIHLYARSPKDSFLYPFHYNVLYLDALGFMPKELLMKVEKEGYTKATSFYGFSYEIYEDFIRAQNSYTNRKYKMGDGTIHLEFDNPTPEPKVVKTAYAYSDDWQLLNSDYEVCEINGGFLGAIIPEGNNKHISLDFVFKPSGFSFGLKVSGIGCIIYLAISTPVIVFLIRKRIKRKED